MNFPYGTPYHGSTRQPYALIRLITLLIRLEVLGWKEWPTLASVMRYEAENGRVLRITSDRAWWRE